MTTTSDRIVGLNGFTAYKPPVRVATTANITLSGAQTIDGIAVVADDRVLVKDQTTGSENGIYVAATGTWTRSKDFNGARDVTTGTQVFVNNGTVGSGTPFQLTTSGTITIGTTSLTFGSVQTATLTGYTLATQTLFATSNIPASAKQVQTAGHTTLGDGGHALYARVGADPSHAGSQQSADGAWWELAETVVTPEMMGVLGAGDVGAALNLAFIAADTLGASMRLTATYNTSVEIVVPSGQMHIENVNDAEINGDLITGADDSIIHFGNGGVTQIGNLSVSPTASSVTLTWGSAHGLAVGDYIAIWNTTVGSWNPDDDAYTAGEWCRIAGITSTTVAVVAQPLYEGYTFGSVEVWKMTPSTYSFAGTFKVRGGAGVVSLKGAKFSECVNTDISGFDVEVEDGHAGISLIRSCNIQGVGVTGVQIGNSGSGLDYGVVVGSCQDIDLTGYFASRRHGASIGGGARNASVVSRNVWIRGTIATHGAATGNTMAADHHGNCEYCGFDAHIFGGIASAGNKNIFRGTCQPNEVGMLVTMNNVIGIDFDFEGMRFVSNIDNSATGRAAFDFGSNGAVFDAATTLGGVINLKNTTWDVPAIQTDSLIEIRNRGATPTEQMIVDLSGAKVISSHASLDPWLFVDEVTGDAMDFVDLTGVYLDRDLPYGSPVNADAWRCSPQTGEHSQTVSNAAATDTEAVTFARRFPKNPQVTLTIEGAQTSVTVAIADSVTTTGFNIILQTADEANFGGNDTYTVHWEAKINDV